MGEALVMVEEKINKIETSPLLHSDAILEEYRQIRAEIRLYLEWRRHSIHFAILISIGTISIGINWQNPYIFLVPVFALFILWFDEIRRLQAIFRYATYIEVFIEKDISGLKLETLAGKHTINRSFWPRMIANAWYLILGIACYGIGSYYMFRPSNLHLEQSLIVWWTLTLLFILISVMLLRKNYVVAIYGRNNEKKLWLEM